MFLKEELTHDLVMTTPLVPTSAEPGSASATRATLAQAVLSLTGVALAASDLPSGITPTLEHLVADTAAVGAAYFQASGDQALTYQVRAAWGDMPNTPCISAIAAHGLPADVPLMRALAGSPQAMFFDDCHSAAETQGFTDLGVASLAAAPVRRADGKLIGAFLMHTFDKHTWGDSEAALFSMVSGTIAALAGRLAAEEQMRLAQEASLRALGLALEARDGETLGHTDRVTSFAMQMAGRLRFTPEQVQALRWGAYLHDIGKIAIPDAVLLKPGKFTPDEWVIMQSHVVAGTSFATALEFLPSAALAVIAQLHERWDGKGYPWGMAGSEISLGARIFALCDVYDALTSDRPYKAAWSREEALAEIQAQSGQHFDPELVTHFVEMARGLDE